MINLIHLQTGVPAGLIGIGVQVGIFKGEIDCKVERMQIIETNVRKKSGAVDANVDQYVDDYLEEEAVVKEIEHEENDMSRIGEDYMDGDPGGDEDDGGDMY